MRLDRPLSEITERAIQSGVENSYRRFIAVVADGREMEPEYVEGIASGRVWSGSDALANGLVDKLGGLEQAIASAAQFAALSDYRTKTIEPILSPKEQFLKEIMGNVHVKALLDNRAASKGVIVNQVQQLLAPFVDGIEFLNTMNDPQGLYLHCTGCVAP
jgi:protease-4